MTLNQQTYQYLDKYKETAKLFRVVSDSSTDIVGVFAEREICYMISRKVFLYYNASDHQAFLKEFNKGIVKLTQFVDIILNFNP